MADKLSSAPPTPPAFIDLFTPPPGYVGTTCLIVGYCADAAFLDEAMLQFTGKLQTTRKTDGMAQGLLFLDPRQSQGLAMQIPGLMCVSHKDSAWKKKRGLLHAKLLWLVFANETTGEENFRIVISTGNWTKSGAQGLIDLAWLSEFNPDRLDKTGESLQKIADSAAAAIFLRKLSTLFNVEILPAYKSVLDRALVRIEALAMKKAARLPKPRVIDSFASSLGGQIKARIAKKRLNFVMAGSGFYEKPALLKNGGYAKPTILSFLECLATESSSHKNIVVVNPASAGAIAASLRDNPKDLERWSVQCAETFDNRRLHAKFIFLAKVQHSKPLQKGARYKNSHLYIGSGNLSKQGLLSDWQHNNGSIELGIFFPLPDELTSNDLKSRLPGGSVIDDLAILRTDAEDDPLDAVPDSTPIIALVEAEPGQWKIYWQDIAIKTRLRLNDTIVEVSPSLKAIMWQEVDALTRAASWSGTNASGRWVSIVIIDRLGGVCRQPFRPMGFDDILKNLIDWKYRATVDDDDSDDDDGDYEDDSGIDHDGKRKSRAASWNNDTDRDGFAVSKAAVLVEQIATVNDTLKSQDVLAWSRRLEALLLEGLDPELIKIWKTHGIDFLACLEEAAFLPACFSDSAQVVDERLQDNYFAALTRVRESFGFAHQGAQHGD